MNIPHFSETYIPLFRHVASVETAYDRKDYLENCTDNPLYGHCGCVAYVMNQRFGFHVMKGIMPNGKSHYWNSYKDGLQFDLTIEQFGDKTRSIHQPYWVGTKVILMENGRFKLFEDRVVEVAKYIRSNIL